MPSLSLLPSSFATTPCHDRLIFPCSFQYHFLCSTFRLSTPYSIGTASGVLEDSIRRLLGKALCAGPPTPWGLAPLHKVDRPAWTTAIIWSYASMSCTMLYNMTVPCFRRNNYTNRQDMLVGCLFCTVLNIVHVTPLKYR